MCHGYHARLSREEELSLLEKRKKQIEDKQREVEKNIATKQPTLTPDIQGA
jgi:prefoldin subunit 5